MRWAMLVIGLLVSLTASTLLVMGLIESGVAVAMGVLGIGMIAISGRWLPKKTDKKTVEPQIGRIIYAPDRQSRALVRQRAEESYRVELEKFIHDYSPDFGAQDRWERQPEIIVTDTLASAVEIAARSVGAGTEEFFQTDEG